MQQPLSFADGIHAGKLPKPKPPMSELSFEDMLSQFKQNSEERICDIKRNTERKNRTRRK